MFTTVTFHRCFFRQKIKMRCNSNSTMKRSIENVESDLETLEWNRLKEQATRKEDFWSLCFAVNKRKI